VAVAIQVPPQREVVAADAAVETAVPVRINSDKKGWQHFYCQPFLF